MKRQCRKQAWGEGVDNHNCAGKKIWNVLAIDEGLRTASLLAKRCLQHEEACSTRMKMLVLRLRSYQYIYASHYHNGLFRQRNRGAEVCIWVILITGASLRRKIAPWFFDERAQWQMPLAETLGAKLSYDRPIPDLEHLSKRAPATTVRVHLPVP